MYIVYSRNCTPHTSPLGIGSIEKQTEENHRKSATDTHWSTIRTLQDQVISSQLS